MKDRMAELLCWQENVWGESEEADTDTEWPQVVMPPEESQALLMNTLETVTSVQNSVESMAQMVEQTKKLHSELEVASFGLVQLKEKLEVQYGRIFAYCTDIRAKLNEMEKVLEDDQTSAGCGSARAKICRAQHQSLSTQLYLILRDFYAAQVTHEEHVKGRIRRQLSILGTEISDDELDDAVHGGGSTLFYCNIQVNVAEAEFKLSMTEERHRQFTAMEDKLHELRNLFLNVQNIVAQDSELIDNIEHNVSKTADYIQEINEVHTYKKAVPVKKRNLRARIVSISRVGFNKMFHKRLRT
ncbi:syntaxin-like [Lingula anatina]|uniref:Syntaxin-like n=1 Tax=Lingula anatina TaxID=7574 RepID=A0A1S3ITE7_LINAN|nr:syntaxin-like [Lingula anatina]|eukprot:XP_013400804.1 syntaxin-like [Lingula anatina]